MDSCSSSDEVCYTNISHKSLADVGLASTDSGHLYDIDKSESMFESNKAVFSKFEASIGEEEKDEEADDIGFDWFDDVIGLKRMFLM